MTARGGPVSLYDRTVSVLRLLLPCLYWAYNISLRGSGPMRYSRLAKRIAVTGEASVRWVLTEDSDDGTLLDVSRQGARLRINHLFQRGQKLTLTLNLPWDKPPVEVRLAAVKWVQEDTVGVEFLKLEDEDRVSLDVFLASRSKLPASSPA